jgi:hypothetical protein
MSHAIKLSRRKYLTAGRSEILFIAEAPPADPARFFYFDQVDSHDWLLALSRTHPHAFRGCTRSRRQAAAQTETGLPGPIPNSWLLPDRRERSAIDASDRPMPARATKATKRARLRVSLDQLVGEVRNLVTGSTRVVLISKSVHEVCYARLKAEGFNVVNTGMIDFPSSGRQGHVARKLRRDLQGSDGFLESANRGLQASLEFFGTGHAKKRERERWIVEHFLQGTLWGAINAWGDRDVQVLVRVRDNINAEVVQPLADGSALVEMVVHEEGRKVGKLQLREIRAQGVDVNGKRFKLRLWTSLLDALRYPAQTLPSSDTSRHYAERWEHELYYRELKLDARNAPILASHTVETALQEVRALVCWRGCESPRQIS